MIKNAVCMSVLLCSIAASLTSFGIVPERAIASQGASQAEYAQIDRLIESSMIALDVPEAALEMVKHRDKAVE